MDRLTLRELAQSINGRLQPAECANTSFQRVSIDSRKINRGDLFWALKGANHDGHDFVHAAIASGACACVISHQHATALSLPTIVVEETHAALARFAAWYRQRNDSLVIGVTGSVGKTTTRELIFAALSSQHPGIRSISNFNNRIGLPLSLLELESHHEFAVIEMGASEFGDIRGLCELARPEVGVITAVGLAHLQSFGSFEAIVQTKGELLEELPSTGFAVLPGDNPVLRQMSLRASCPVIFVGESEDSRVRARAVEVQPNCLRFHCEGQDFLIPATGRHILSNALCAIAVGLEIGIQPRMMAEGLAMFQGAPGRCTVIDVGPWTVIDDTYNASPLAMTAACHLLQETRTAGGGQKLLILGDMRELGDVASEEHERIGSLATQLGIDRILACGTHADDIARGARQQGMKPHQIVAARDAETLMAMLDCWLQPNDVLLVKGSRATRMERIIEWLKDRASYECYTNTDDRQRRCA